MTSVLYMRCDSEHCGMLASTWCVPCVEKNIRKSENKENGTVDKRPSEGTFQFKGVSGSSTCDLGPYRSELEMVRDRCDSGGDGGGGGEGGGGGGVWRRGSHEKNDKNRDKKECRTSWYVFMKCYS